jgi:hypothetical protein
MNEQLDRMEIQIAALAAKVDAAYESSEKMRRYMLIGAWVTAGAMLVPLLILPLVLPALLGSVALPAGL